MMTPTIYLNGTSKDELITQVETAAHAMRAAIDALNDAAPNARDYAPQGPAAFRFAASEHRLRVETLTRIKDDMETIWATILDA